MTIDMFNDEAYNAGQTEAYFNDVTLLRSYAASHSDTILKLLQLDIIPYSPFRHMKTPGGNSMSAEMTNCGHLGWITDAKGYRYVTTDPLTKKHWPEMPELMLDLAQSCASAAGYPDFIPDSCIINRYACGAKMSLHQDRDEHDFSAPIVSVSFGIPAIFLLGGLTRQDKGIKIPLFHGDVIVWGGQDRLRFHGIAPVKAATHDKVGDVRINLTFRKAS